MDDMGLTMDDSMDIILDAVCQDWEEKLISDQFDLSGDVLLQQLPSQLFNHETKLESDQEAFDVEGDEIIAGIVLADDPFDSEGDELVAAIETSSLSGNHVQLNSMDNVSLSEMDLSCKRKFNLA
jgi:hypothetical protein